VYGLETAQRKGWQDSIQNKQDRQGAEQDRKDFDFQPDLTTRYYKKTIYPKMPIIGIMYICTYVLMLQ
jgi:hypothetical protein